MSRDTREPLKGRTIVLTRPEEGGRELADRLEALGASVLLCPAIRLVRSVDPRAWRRALDLRPTLTHIVFTSATAVRFFDELGREAGLGPAAWAHAFAAAVGERTARELEERGWRVGACGRGGGAALARLLVEGAGVGPGARVLLPRSAAAEPAAGELLEAAGASVLALPLYDTVPEDPARARPFLDALDEGRRIDAVVFASPSALKAFLELTGVLGRRLLESPSPRAVTIGPTTTAAVRKAGFEVLAEAERPGTEGLLAACLEALGS